MDREHRQWVRRMEIRKVDASFLPLVEHVYWLLAAEGVHSRSRLKVACTDAAFKSLARFQDQVIGVLHDCYASGTRYIEAPASRSVGRAFPVAAPTQACRGRGKQRR